jgi:hypothetical protein
MDKKRLGRWHPKGPGTLPRFGCLFLALAASMISVLMAALMGLTMGGNFYEKTLWSTFGVTSVLAAHWLLSISRGSRLGLRVMAWAIWAVCMAYATYSHATYFLLTQQEAGMRRAEAPLHLRESDARTRTLSSILAQEARIRAELTKAASSACQDCRWTRGRIADLIGRIKALEAEAEEARRDQALRDRADQLRDQRRVDPVTAKLAAWLGFTQAGLALAPALVGAMILDSLATLCWLLVTQGRDSPGEGESQASVTEDDTGATVTPTVSEKLGTTSPTPTPPSKEVRDLEDLVREAKAACAAGKIAKMTVNQVRSYLGCSQEKASTVCRALRPVQQSTGILGPTQARPRAAVDGQQGVPRHQSQPPVPAIDDDGFGHRAVREDEVRTSCRSPGRVSAPFPERGGTGAGFVRPAPHSGAG